MTLSLRKSPLPSICSYGISPFIIPPQSSSAFFFEYSESLSCQGKYSSPKSHKHDVELAKVTVAIHMPLWHLHMMMHHNPLCTHILSSCHEAHQHCLLNIWNPSLARTNIRAQNHIIYCRQCPSLLLIFYLHHLLDIIRGKQCLIVTSTFLITTVQYLRIVMLIAIVVVVWPFIAIRITYQTLILSVSSAYFHAWPSLPSAVNNYCSLPPILN